MQSPTPAPQELEDLIAQGMRKYGPDGHIDGHEKIAEEVWNWCLERVPAPLASPQDIAQKSFIEGFNTGAHFHATFHGWDGSAARDAWEKSAAKEVSQAPKEGEGQEKEGAAYYNPEILETMKGEPLPAVGEPKTALLWSRGRPTEAGWYTVRGPGFRVCIEVQEIAGLPWPALPHTWESLEGCEWSPVQWPREGVV
jgi:hypothetical protein